MSNEHCPAWIKMSDRKPTAGDCPIWVYGDFLGGQSPIPVLVRSFNTASMFCADHLWMPAKIPAPPSEPTQQELDQRAFTEWSDSEPESRYIAHESRAWNYGISYERSEIRRLIERHRNGELPAPELIRLISARVKL